MVYVQNPKESADKLLEITSKFSKVIDTRSMYKNQMQLYALVTNNYKGKKKNHFKYHSLQYKNIKNLGISLKMLCKTLHKKKLQRNTRINERKPKQIEGYVLFMDWKSQYCEM